jgi:hypothetical protein
VDVIASGAPDAPEAQLVEIAGVDIDPPPSKVGFDPTVPAPDVEVLEQGVELAVGLRPPESSSVAPSGIPPSGILPSWDDAFDIDEPSGDVAPMPGVALTCAKPASQRARISRTAPAIVKTRRIRTSVFLAARKVGRCSPSINARNRSWMDGAGLGRAPLIAAWRESGRLSKRRGE